MVIKSIVGAACTSLAVVSFNATAALYDRGGGLIYDDTFDITWLMDANSALGSYYDAYDGSSVDGRMDPENAPLWAGTLDYYDPVRDVTWSDWRLAKSSEMVHLFDIDGVSSATPSPFINVQPDYYWTYGSIGLPSGLYRYRFNFSTGEGYIDDTFYEDYVWAVRDGDVGTAVVPVPAAAWLFGSGLIGLFGLSRRKARV